MAEKTTKRKKPRTAAQKAATKRMLEGLARSKRKRAKKSPAKKATKKKAPAKKAAKTKAKKTTTPKPSPGVAIIGTAPLAKGTRFAGWKSNTPGDMREIKLPANARIVTRGKRAVIVYTDK